MTRRSFCKIAALTLFLLFFGSHLFAEIIYDNDFGFSLDIPEGFELTDSTEDGTSILLTHPNIPITLAIKIYYQKEYNSSTQTLDAALNKLSAQGNMDEVDYQGGHCALSTFTMNLDQQYKGWAVSAPVKLDSYLVVLCYAPENLFEKCQYFIVSAINSLCINDDYYKTPGIFIEYAFPKSGKKAISTSIAGKEINSFIDSSDADAADCLINIEYSVLMLYANHPKIMEAWERYYRLIYRDSFSRLENFSSELYKALYPIAESENPENPQITYAQKLLSWVQDFHYRRADKVTNSDFTSLPAMLLGEGNDCDSRSMLLCVLLKSAGIESTFLLYPTLSHAMVGAAIKAPGQTYKLKDTNEEFIMGETTAHVTWGTIAQDFADRNKCVPVILP